MRRSHPRRYLPRPAGQEEHVANPISAPLLPSHRQERVFHQNRSVRQKPRHPEHLQMTGLLAYQPKASMLFGVAAAIIVVAIPAKHTDERKAGANGYPCNTKVKSTKFIKHISTFMIDVEKAETLLLTSALLPHTCRIDRQKSVSHHRFYSHIAKQLSYASKTVQKWHYKAV